MNKRLHHHRTKPGGPPRRRGGYIYLAVLFTSLIVVATVAAALSISTASLRTDNDRADRAAALRLAESELHRQAAIMRTSGQWRSDETSGLFSSWYSLTIDGVNVTGTSLVRRRFTDIDGQLDDDDNDSVELTIHAKAGRSEAAITATLESDPEPYDVLHYSVSVSDDIQFESGAALSCENAVQVFDDCKTNSSGVLTTPTLHCSNSVQMTLRGDVASSAVTLPSRDVLADYISAGTQIPFASIPQQSGDLVLRDIVLSPTVNPYGATDAAGIYWLDAGGNDVRILHCRMDATLAIRNAGTIIIGGGITWSYPTDPDAILVSDSKIRWLNVAAKLDEAARGTNFNPIASPYRGTLSNTNITDVYPTELRGVIFTTDDMRFDPLIGNRSLHISGAMVCRDLTIHGHVHVTQLDELLENPAAGLSDPTPMRFVRGSQRRIPSP